MFPSLFPWPNVFEDLVNDWFSSDFGTDNLFIK